MDYTNFYGSVVILTLILVGIVEAFYLVVYGATHRYSKRAFRRYTIRRRAYESLWPPQPDFEGLGYWVRLRATFSRCRKVGI